MIDDTIDCDDFGTWLRTLHKYPFRGSERTVLTYVKRRKAEMELERAKTYERLEHPPGEAQADFTTIEVCRNHQLVSYKLLVLSFPYSNASFVYSGTGGEPGMLFGSDETSF